MSLLLTLFACGAPAPDVWLNPNDVTTDAGLFALQLAGDPLPAIAGEVFTLEIGVDGATNAAFALEPWMPEHGHGIPDAPVVTAGDDANAFVATWIYSMPGYWEVQLDVTADEGGDGVTLAWNVE